MGTGDIGGRNRKILVVDDELDVRMTIAQALEGAGEVLEAATGEEALRIIAAERPRVIVLDLEMPGMSGIALLEALQAAAAPMTVMILTGQSDAEVKKRVLELGVAEYIDKPPDWNLLQEKVQRFLDAAP